MVNLPGKKSVWQDFVTTTFQSNYPTYSSTPQTKSDFNEWMNLNIKLNSPRVFLQDCYERDHIALCTPGKSATFNLGNGFIRQLVCLRDQKKSPFFPKALPVLQRDHLTSLFQRFQKRGA